MISRIPTNIYILKQWFDFHARYPTLIQVKWSPRDLYLNAPNHTERFLRSLIHSMIFFKVHQVSEIPNFGTFFFWVEPFDSV